MRSTSPLRSHTQSQGHLRRTLSPTFGTPPQSESVPTIRLISAIPTAVGAAPSLGDPFLDTSITTPPSMSDFAPTSLAPKEDIQAPRKRLVPKKSKLGLLVSGKRGKTPENNDLTDGVRRVGSKKGLEVYVDPTAQSEVGEVLMVKKKKSRAALSGLKWGTLADVTNSAPSKDSTQTVRLKNEDKEKWWSIGRGRKDSKDVKIIEKENPRLNPEAPSETLASRARFNSLDSRLVLGASAKTAERPAQVRSASASESPLQDSDFLKDASHVPTISCPVAEERHEPPLLAPANTTTGSIALRAMRSMRSVARLTSWANGKPMEKDTTHPMPQTKKHKQPAATKKNKKTEKRKSDSGRDQMTLRLSGGSLEAGVPTNIDTSPIRSSTVRKHGVLGLGLPSGFRFGTMRSSSAGSSRPISAVSENTTSLDHRGRTSSTVSAASSLKLTSTKSRVSSSSSGPVKWVEERLETVKVACRRERTSQRTDEAQRKYNQGRHRGAIVDMFSEQTSRPVSSKSAPSASWPILTDESPSANGQFTTRSEPMATPRRQTRARPASDQMTEKERFRSMRHDSDSVLSALDAATNELASLISRLDLEATPGTPRGTLHVSPSFTNLLAESPLKSSPHKKGSSMTLPGHPSMVSQSSIRPFPQTQKVEDIPNTQRCGQQIAPWPVSPPTSLPTSTPHVRPTSSTPLRSVLATSPPEECPTARIEQLSFVSRPLQPAKSRKALRPAPTESISSSTERSPTSAANCSVAMEPPSTKSRPISKKKSIGVLANSPKEFTLGRTFRKVMSTLSLSTNKATESSLSSDLTGVPMSEEVQKDLGLAGTLGGSMSSRNLHQSMDLDDPDSDIPNELQGILTGDMLTSLPQSLSLRPPSPGLPPESPLPTPVISHTSVMHSNMPVIPMPWVDDEQQSDPDESDSPSMEENDTRRSFDFTSELKRLSESAGSHRYSFMEQLENAFRTPAKYDLDGFDGFGQFGPYEDVPPVPPIPTVTSSRHLSSESSDLIARASDPISSLLPSPEIVPSKKRKGAASSHELSQSLHQDSFVSSKPSYGQLDLNFKFGGPSQSANHAEKSPLTLSDIIPPPAHARSLSMASVREDASSQRSTVSQAMSTQAPSSCSSVRRRADSFSSSKYSLHGDTRVDVGSSHSRTSSRISFRGLETFDEIRRGFEFAGSRPAFYPPSSFDQQRNQMPRDSMISIASVSSYGMVINPGVKDPFDYGYQSRPASADMSAFVTMSTSVDDTFSFIRRGPRRKRVDSDSSSFYFRAPGVSRILRPLKSQFRRDSVISTASIAPPVSIYNRSFGIHRRIDSASSIGSGPQGYPPYGFAAGNRSSWAPSHRRDRSADSIMSDISMRISRPNLGDKMLDSRHDYCLPLTSITASPPGDMPSDYSYEHVKRRRSFDSIMDDEQSYSRDSIMDQSNRKSSSESVFGEGGSLPVHSPPGQFHIHDDRPFSLFSAEDDSSDPKCEDDTMISMIGGGRVRRRSVGSFVEGSPIFVRVGKRKAKVMRGQQRRLVQQPGAVESPNLSQKVERSPCGLGEERMMFARQGLLSRDSLEEHCLCADGVDTSFMTEPVFSRPVPVSRSRSGTNSSTSSGLDTPSLSSSGETSSVASDSISSIDLSHVNVSLTNMSYPIIMQSRTRMRSKGHGHRRRLSGIQISRASVYETIEEENNSPISDGFQDSVNTPLSPVIDDNVIIVDPDDTCSIEWDERGIAALRKYYTLKDETDVTLKESKQLWLDTQFSIYAVQSFEPPSHRSGMRALLEHSRQTYGPLSAEYRRIRSRTSSRPSPYPQPQRAIKISLSPSAVGPEVHTVVAPNPALAPALSAAPAPISVFQPLQQRTIDKNTVAAEVPSLVPGKTGKGDSGPLPQSRFSSNARRSAPVSTKRSIGKENQERESSSGTMTAPGENQRLNRPRPRGRPAHARAVIPMRA